MSKITVENNIMFMWQWLRIHFQGFFLKRKEHYHHYANGFSGLAQNFPGASSQNHLSAAHQAETE